MLVSIIIVGWNHWFTLKNCFDSIYQQNYRNIEIIFIDNASFDGSVSNVRQTYPKVKVIANKDNLGFCRGNNAGIKEASGEYIFILNPDVILEPNSITELVDASTKDPNVGICTPKLLLHPGRVINSVGMRFNKFGRVYHMGDGELDIGQYEEMKNIPMVAGACMFCKKDMFIDIGMFDEDYFAYSEDTELSLRAWWMGWKCIYVPTAVACHVRNSAAKKYSQYVEIARYHEQRNRYWNILTYMPFCYLFKALPLIIAKESTIFIKGLLRAILYGRRPIEVRARIAFFRMLPRLIKKRFHINSRRKITTEYPLSFFIS